MDCYGMLRFAIFHLLFSLIVSCIQGRLQDPMERNAVKTIKTRYGDVYDCVELYKQPALNHRLLKNHKIQMRPSFAPQKDATIGNGCSGNSIDVGLPNACPLGTVPIRRRSRTELSKAKAMFRQHFQSFHHTSTRNSPTDFAFAGLATIKKGSTTYHGAGGMVSINNPSVAHGQYSSSLISVEGTSGNQASIIRVGWMVNVDLYPDNHTRLFTIWGEGIPGGMKGCYNTDCPGFVQTDTRIALDMVLEPVSVVRGPVYYVKFAVNQDDSTGNWWLMYGEDDIAVGYWPKSLLSNLQKGANALRWGGLVYTFTPQFPAMGNGDNGVFHSSHFRRIKLKYEAGSDLNGTIDAPTGIIQTSCFKSGDNSYKDEYWGYSFYFGGDGGDATQCIT